MCGNDVEDKEGGRLRDAVVEGVEDGGKGVETSGDHAVDSGDDENAEGQDREEGAAERRGEEPAGGREQDGMRSDSQGGDDG